MWLPKRLLDSLNLTRNSHSLVLLTGLLFQHRYFRSKFQNTQFSSLHVNLKSKELSASLCPLPWFWPSGARRCWQTVLQLHMVGLWLPLLFAGEGGHVLAPTQAPLPGSDLPNYHPAKRPLARAGLSLCWVSSQHFLSVRAGNLCFSASSLGFFCFLFPPSPQSPSLSSLSTHSITSTFSLRRISPTVFIASPCCPDMKS